MDIIMELQYEFNLIRIYPTKKRWVMDTGVGTFKILVEVIHIKCDLLSTTSNTDGPPYIDIVKPLIWLEGKNITATFIDNTVTLTDYKPYKFEEEDIDAPSF